MFRDLRAEGSGDAEYDVCVVGSGPAGLALAESLADRGHRVGVLESGALEVEPAPQELNDGRQRGFRDSLRDARPRAFGGASSVWVGHCATLDPDDLAGDRWSGSPGWPIAYQELASWYPPALAFLGIEPALLDRAPDHDGHLIFDDGHLESKPFVQRQTRLGGEHRQRIAGDQRIDLWLHATAVEARSRGGRLTALLARDLGDGELRVVARQFVIAAGGIENPRLLHWWTVRGEIPIDPRAAALVGRCFALHPHFFYGALLLTNEAARNPLYRPRETSNSTYATTALQISAAARHRQRLIKVLFRHEQPAQPEQSRWYDADRLGMWRDSERLMFDTMFLQTAMPLDDGNRIVLDDRRDPLGMPRVKARLSLDADVYRNFRRSLTLYVAELGRHGYGRVKFGVGVFDRYISGRSTLWGGHHFMCATRMAASPDAGVVDGDLRLFGCDNLYVAGASSFAGTGAVNPTLTVVALALRLARHLHDRL